RLPSEPGAALRIRQGELTQRGVRIQAPAVEPCPEGGERAVTSMARLTEQRSNCAGQLANRGQTLAVFVSRRFRRVIDEQDDPPARVFLGGRPEGRLWDDVPVLLIRRDQNPGRGRGNP